MPVNAEMHNENIIYGGPVSLDFTQEFTSLGEFVLSALSVHGDRVALIDGQTEKQLTYTEILEGSLKMAEYYTALGVKRGDIIGVISENCIEYTFVVFGAFLIGASITTCNLTYTEDELKHALLLTKPKIVFVSPFAVYNLSAAATDCHFIKKIIQFGEFALLENITMFNDIMNDPKLKANPKFVSPAMNMDDEVALIMLSSGTTGLPKGVQITQANILATIASSLESKKNLHIEDDIVLLSILPWFHVYGLLSMVHSTTAGVLLVMLPKFEEDLFLSTIQKYKTTHSFMVPPLMVFLAKHPSVDNYDLSSLRELYCGAAPLSREVEDAVLKRIPSVQSVRQGYGMSETTLGILHSREQMTKPGSVGIVAQGAYCKVIDPDTGKILGPNERGELCFKGKVVMKGYIGNEEATKQTIDKDGWLHTGDIGYYDNDRYFYIVDRLKELIKYKAFQVAPAELEAILLTHPSVQDAAVIGKPDEASGELPLAFVVKRADVDVTEKEIQAFVAAKVSPSKRLRGGVRFIDEIPKNLSGKILRRELRTLLTVPKSKL